MGMPGGVRAQMSFKGATIHTNLTLLLGLALLAFPVPARGQVQAPEDQVKAAYLLNFAKLGEWPRGALPDGPLPLVVGVSGGDAAFLDVLKAVVSGKAVGSHALLVKSVSSEEDMKACHIVFFRGSDKKRIQTTIAGLTRAGVLLVGEDESFLGQGGMINLIRDHGSVRFEVNADALDRSQIHFSSKIMALAKAGYGATPTVASNAPVETGRRLEHSSPPEYPAIAEKMKLTGTVQVQAQVMADGTVKEVTVLGGHPLLADALVRAVKQWKYQPARKETMEVVKFSFSPQ